MLFGDCHVMILSLNSTFFTLHDKEHNLYQKVVAYLRRIFTRSTISSIAGVRCQATSVWCFNDIMEMIRTASWRKIINIPISHSSSSFSMKIFHNLQFISVYFTESQLHVCLAFSIDNHGPYDSPNSTCFRVAAPQNHRSRVNLPMKYRVNGPSPSTLAESIKLH